ncbi:HTH domain-containing protein [Silvimonas amylolytica]|nr:HTH domain-containing protein [Silvimonas amylolytica]
MDSLITAAARALATGDALGALNRVALREDPPALALRGIAMAQLGDLPRARQLLRRAAQGFGPKEAVSRARCVVAEAEIALAVRDLTWPTKALESAQLALGAQGDRFNAAHAQFVMLRRLLLLGRLPEAERILMTVDANTLPPSLRAVHGLIESGIAMRRLQSSAARIALANAAQAAAQARIGALMTEIAAAARLLDAPAARLITQGQSQTLRLDEIETLQKTPVLIVDACRNTVRDATHAISLATRPILFVLMRTLGEAWPADAARDELIARAFRIRHPDDTHRARLRVEMGRLRKLLHPAADIQATRRGFVLVPRYTQEVAVLAPIVEDANAAVLALLADGESWSSSALALALGTSQRTVQRALDTLNETGKVQYFGQGRARRWLNPPMPGFATTLLLPAPFADG